jgi:hypothetical protein
MYDYVHAKRHPEHLALVKLQKRKTQILHLHWFLVDLSGKAWPSQTDKLLHITEHLTRWHSVQ